MTQEALEHANALKLEIGKIGDLISKLTPYEGSDVEITLIVKKTHGLGYDNGESRLEKFHQNQYNDNIAAAMIEVLRNYHTDLIKEFESIKCVETEAEIKEMPKIGLWGRLHKKWSQL